MSTNPTAPWPEDSIEARIQRRAQTLGRSFSIDPERGGLTDRDIDDLNNVLIDRAWTGAQPPTDTYEAIRATKAPRGGADVQYYQSHQLGPYEKGIHAHEAGHLIDLRGNVLSALNALSDAPHKQQISKQLARASKWFTDQRGGYFEDSNTREQLADGIALYLRQPDLMMSRYPDLARFIGDTVDADPMMSGVVSFTNSRDAIAHDLCKQMEEEP